jgi:hypothetical protein
MLRNWDLLFIRLALRGIAILVLALLLAFLPDIKNVGSRDEYWILVLDFFTSLCAGAFSNFTVFLLDVFFPFRT